MLTERELEFLRESNAIENIHSIDYADPENSKPGEGHAGAFFLSQTAGKTRARVSVEDICIWQRQISSEQVRFGHDIPASGIGRLRGPDNPHNVRVGDHIAPPFAEVAGLMHGLVSDLVANLEALEKAPDGVGTVKLVGDIFQRFEAIHPFVDGNGRTGRLLANYILAFCRFPLAVFRCDERRSFYAAHRSKHAMRVFMAGKARETVVGPDGALWLRVGGDRQADRYRSEGGEEMILEWHDLGVAIRRWETRIAPPQND